MTLQVMGYSPTFTFLPLELDSDLQEIMFNATLDVMCGTPQPLVIDSYKELGLVKGSSDKVFPGCFRVNRCRHSGCCADGFVCKAKHSALVEKRFLLYETNTQQVQLKYHSVVSHSNCSCVRLISCRKQTCEVTQVWNKDTCSCECASRCPDQYIQDRNTCLCECALDDRQCLQISKGIIKLPKDQCRALDWNAIEFVPCEKGKTFYKDCCKCLKKPCEKARASIQRKVQTSSGPPSDKTPVVGDTPLLSSSFSVSIISKIDEASFDSQKNLNKYKLMSQSNMDEHSSSEDSSEE
ncbi:vascular endothelial growth factor C-like [Anneissia japonica]|uniref:vascular endothelial growth factor C-like n=1 Tax=Anneissia japonica TaxID=1529436 RepID=UPI0014256B4C|nr:vascular endothelial growth factor C-like [Anneissia japonica]